jgi:hypothetical protein
MKPQLLSFSLTIDLFQVAVHAIGDRANDLILDLYSSVASKNGMRDRRFRVSLSLKYEKPSIIFYLFENDKYIGTIFSTKATV